MYKTNSGGFCAACNLFVAIMSSIQSDDSTADELAVIASFDSLPEEVARIVLGYLGYHQTPAASEVCMFRSYM